MTYDDATLHVLTKSPVTDPVTGTADAWASVPVRQPSASCRSSAPGGSRSVSRTLTAVTVPGADLAVTGDREIGVWQASGSTFWPGRPGDPDH